MAVAIEESTSPYQRSLLRDYVQLLTSLEIMHFIHLQFMHLDSRRLLLLQIEQE